MANFFKKLFEPLITKLDGALADAIAETMNAKIAAHKADFDAKIANVTQEQNRIQRSIIAVENSQSDFEQRLTKAQTKVVIAEKDILQLRQDCAAFKAEQTNASEEFLADFDKLLGNVLKTAGDVGMTFKDQFKINGVRKSYLMEMNKVLSSDPEKTLPIASYIEMFFGGFKKHKEYPELIAARATASITQVETQLHQLLDSIITRKRREIGQLGYEFFKNNKGGIESKFICPKPNETFDPKRHNDLLGKGTAGCRIKSCLLVGLEYEKGGVPKIKPAIVELEENNNKIPL